jgi:hypothetical protein
MEHNVGLLAVGEIVVPGSTLLEVEVEACWTQAASAAAALPAEGADACGNAACNACGRGGACGKSAEQPPVLPNDIGEALVDCGGVCDGELT